MRETLSSLTASEIAELTSAARVPTVEIIEATLALIDDAEPQINAFITVTADRALRTARALDEHLRRSGPVGPLHGVPFAVKDMVQLAGAPWTCGSAGREQLISESDAVVVRALESAGAVAVGTNNMHEWAFGATSDNPHHGPVRNPRSLDRIPGGSSGGSAAAVAAGVVPFALGTDAGGSVRVPAAYCGVMGLRVTPGRFSTRGVHPQSWSFDTVGPLVRTPGDLALVYQVLAATGRLVRGPASTAGRLTGLRVGVPSSVGASRHRMDAQVAEAFDDCIEALLTAGARVSEVVLPSEPDVTGAFFTVVLAETAAVHGQHRVPDRLRYGRDIQELLEQGDAVAAVDYLAALRFRQQAFTAVQEVFGEVDLLLTPTTPDRAEPRGATTIVWPDGTEEGLLDALPRFCLLPSLIGLPALSLPVQARDQGLPAGIQVIAQPGAEVDLIDFARATEALSGWHWAPPGLSEAKRDVGPVTFPPN